MSSPQPVVNTRTRTADEVTGDRRRHVAMPLGGIGTGTVAFCGDGSIRQWQLHNIGNHMGYVPAFFALRVSQVEPPYDALRLLQATPPPPDEHPAPLVTDGDIPAGQRRLHEAFPLMAGSRFRGIYPFADVAFEDDDLPVAVDVSAMNPLVPFDVASSSLPVVLVTVSVLNRSEIGVHGWLGAAQQNAVGWDGVTPIEDNRCSLYGGNVNRLRRRAGWTALVMENPALPEDAPGAGQFVLSTDSPTARGYLQWQRADELAAFLRGRASFPDRREAGAEQVVHSDSQASGPVQASAPSPAGATWNGALALPFQLAPGEKQVFRFVLAWRFPNRYVNFPQFGLPRTYGHSRFWLGNAYAERFADAVDVAETVQTQWSELHASTRAWTDALLDSSLPLDVVERLAAQPSLLRSPTCFATADGRFFGFEGTLGASTAMWTGNYGGSCPLNCTHVWNYAQAVASLFPELERSMRETEYDVMQAPEGYLPHRVLLPAYHRQLWDAPIGGPEEPALDGMLGSVLKAYREVRQGAGRDWLQRYWPSIRRLLEHVRGKWDPDRTGVLRGTQPSTHDIDLCGVNSFMGTYWLAALRAAEEMALLLEDKDYAVELRELFDKGSRAYDELLWNGEYYVQKLDGEEPRDYQWLDGCLSDQLIGQWWAHQLDLGYILPRDHVRTALASVVKYNLRHGFRDFQHIYRVYADLDDSGLLICSWPLGNRPAVPTRYADEVWTGVEYQVAAHCLQEGLTDEGLAILRALWARHDGSRRNPYNEIECGDHYARAMAGWSVLNALTGTSWDAVEGRLRLRPAGVAWLVPVLTSSGWGTARTEGDGGLVVECRGGRMDVRSVALPGSATDVLVRVDGAAVAATVAATDDGVVVTPERLLELRPGSAVAVRLGV
jgi:uncharacterized protein (DUF608 family)